MTSALARAAMAYATRLGWYVFPLKHKKKVPYGRLVWHGHKSATRDPEQIRRWWEAAPDAGVALSCAMSGLVVLDADLYKAECDFRELEARLGCLPETPRQITPRGGEHYVFKDQGGRYRDPCPGAETQHNGYIVLAPSVGPDSPRPYMWDRAAHPLETPVANLPAEWRAHLLVPQAPLRSGAPDPRSEVDAADTWLGYAFAKMGWLGAPLPDGKRAARCPWVEEHTDGRGAGHDSSTVLLPPTAGKTFGGFHCAHAHCAGRTGRDVLALLPSDVRWAADRAVRREQTRLTLERIAASRKAGAR
jgi:hypothetical protein